MKEYEKKQYEDTKNYFNQILPYNLPRNETSWKLINQTTDSGHYKPLATIMIHKNDIYIKKVMEGFLVDKMMSDAEKELKETCYDITLVVKRGTSLISITKSKDENNEWYCMYCIPINDKLMIDKVMRDMQKQNQNIKTVLIK